MFVVIIMRMTELGPRFSVPFAGTQPECAKRAVELRRQHAPGVQTGTYTISYAQVDQPAPVRAR